MDREIALRDAFILALIQQNADLQEKEATSFGYHVSIENGNEFRLYGESRTTICKFVIKKIAILTFKRSIFNNTTPELVEFTKKYEKYAMKDTYISDVILAVLGTRNEMATLSITSEGRFNGISYFEFNGSGCGAKCVLPMHPIAVEKIVEYIRKETKCEFAYCGDSHMNPESLVFTLINNILDYKNQ
jgi:hypothetical protein